MKLEIPLPPNIHDMDHDPVIGAKELAEELAGLLDNQSGDKAMMIGIFGQWGRGKTFLMDHIWKQLEKKGKDNNFERVDFHAWKYQDTPASWAYLYEAFANKYFETPQRQNFKFPLFIWEYIKSWIKNYFRRIKINVKDFGWFPLTVFILSLIGSITWGYISLKIEIFFKLISLFVSTSAIVYTFSKIFLIYKKSAIQLFKKYTKKRSYSERLGLQKEIQDDLKILLEVWLPEKKRLQNKKILLFVDDLDRCSEDRLIQVIDSLRVMLEDKTISRRVIALIAVDDRILVRAINFKYQRIIGNPNELGELNISILTREYLDKLFLIGVKLSPLNDSEKEAIMYSIVKDKLAHITRKSVQIGQAEPNHNNGSQTAGINESNNPPASQNLTEANYKIIPFLFEIKKIKKLPPLILEQLRNHKDEIIGANRFKEILNLANIPKEETDLILTHCEFHPELNEDEYERFLKLLPFLESATPRSIRILYYQYILAKRLLKRYDPMYNEEFRAHALLDFLLLVYRYRSPERKKLLNEYLSKKEFDKFKEDFAKDFPGNDEINNIIQRIKEIEPNMLERMRRIIDIVVAY